MAKIQYFMSGTCYKKGTSEAVRRFSGITTQTFSHDPDPQMAIESIKKQEFQRCADAGKGEVYVHIEQMNTL